MNWYKIFKNTCATAMSIFALSSCGDDFLDIAPQSSLSSTTFFKTEGDFVQALNGVYAPLRDIYGIPDRDTPGTGAWLMGEMRSDNTHYILNTGNRGFEDAEAIDGFLDDPLNGRTNAKYYNNFILIGRANQIISRIDEATFAQSSKDNIKGQALFLRALAYFDLVQYYGAVPLHLVPTTTMENASLPRSTVDEVYNQIISDATEAGELLPLKSDQQLGRATKGSANTLLGNVYLVLKRWADAEAILKQVATMGYSLVPVYADVFKTTNENNLESIFEVQYLAGATQGQQSNFIYNFLPRLSDPSVITGVAGSANSQGGWNTPTPDLIADYDPGDSRKDASIAFIGGYPYIKKYMNPHSIWNNTDDNFPIYRYAEVLLMIAEALNEQNKSAEALPYLNQVRDRAFGAGVSPVRNTNQEALREDILHERRIELAFENKRWLDLVRTGKAVEVMNAQGAKIKANPEAYYYSGGFKPIAASYNVTDDRLLFPLPFRELQLNKALEQNNGY
jgi:tetratricopeptide (TPR) repeat protein